jgi:hypothetical protein
MSFFLLLVVLIPRSSLDLSPSLVPVFVKTTNNRNNSSHVWDYCPFGCLLLLLLSLVFVSLTNTEPDFEREGGENSILIIKRQIRVSSIYVNRLLQTMIDNWHSLPNKKYGIELKNQQLTLKWFKEKENKIVKK